MAALSPEQRLHLEQRAELHSLPKDAWPAIPGAVIDAVQWATTSVAADLRLYHQDWGWTRCLDEAEDTLLRPGHGLSYLPKSVRTTYARWLRAAGLLDTKSS